MWGRTKKEKPSQTHLRRKTRLQSHKPQSISSLKKKNMPLTDRRIHREMRKTNSHDVYVNMSVSIYMAVWMYVPQHHPVLSPQRGPQHYITLCFSLSRAGRKCASYSMLRCTHTHGTAANRKAPLSITHFGPHKDFLFLSLAAYTVVFFIFFYSYSSSCIYYHQTPEIPFWLSASNVWSADVWVRSWTACVRLWTHSLDASIAARLVM